MSKTVKMSFDCPECGNAKLLGPRNDKTIYCPVCNFSIDETRFHAIHQDEIEKEKQKIAKQEMDKLVRKTLGKGFKRR